MPRQLRALKLMPFCRRSLGLRFRSVAKTLNGTAETNLVRRLNAGLSVFLLKYPKTRLVPYPFSLQHETSSLHATSGIDFQAVQGFGARREKLLSNSLVFPQEGLKLTNCPLILNPIVRGLELRREGNPIMPPNSFFFKRKLFGGFL